MRMRIKSCKIWKIKLGFRKSRKLKMKKKKWLKTFIMKVLTMNNRISLFPISMLKKKFLRYQQNRTSIVIVKINLQKTNFHYKKIFQVKMIMKIVSIILWFKTKRTQFNMWLKNSYTKTIINSMILINKLNNRRSNMRLMIWYMMISSTI
jgi:hypothetical protein